MGDPTKLHLQQNKDNACQMAQRVKGLEGPLGESLREVVSEQIRQACFGLDCVLHSAASPLYTPEARSVFWGIPETHLLSLAGAAETACESACEALEAYCAVVGGGGGAHVEAFVAEPTSTLLQRAAQAAWRCRHYYARVIERSAERRLAEVA